MTFRDNESFDSFGVWYDTVFDCRVVGTRAMQEHVLDTIAENPVLRILGDVIGEDAEILEHEAKDTLVAPCRVVRLQRWRRVHIQLCGVREPRALALLAKLPAPFGTRKPLLAGPVS